MRLLSLLVGVSLCPIAASPAADARTSTTLRCEVVDASSGRALPARVYLRAEGGEWFFARSAATEGSAVEYRKQRFAASIEMHTTVSAHPFLFALPPGRYTLRVERGKEYLPDERVIEINEEPAEITVRLRRWIDMAALGWYSGDTHVHRSVDELRNVLLAEDLNVGLPLSFWVTVSHTPPDRGDKTSAADVPAKPIYVDPTHVIYPMNTEWEIFQVAGRRHTLGAVFALGHKAPFPHGAPPVGPIAEEARRQGALMDLDKHSWPWSLMLVPVMNVGLFELANNHVWQTEFGFRQWTFDALPPYMRVERDEGGFTEWGWIDFGFQTYYSLLNCGFPLKPSAGTASGVHPVPLGFGRVYVQLADAFSYERWMKGLAAGRSFVTTGPMLMVQLDGRPPGATILSQPDAKRSCRITGTAVSIHPLKPIEIVVNGRVVKQVPAENEKGEPGNYRSDIRADVELDGSSWIAVRVLEDRPDGRVRFAHTSPVHVEIPGRPLRPRREEVDYLVRRMREEIERNEGILQPDELDEYRQALRAYEGLEADER